MHTLWHILLDFFYFCDNSYNLPSAYLVELPTIQRFWSLQIASGNLHVFDLYQVHPMQEMGFKLYFGKLHLIEEFHLCCYISFDAIFSQGYQKILTKCFKVVTTNFVFSTDCFCPCTTSQPSKPAFLLENYIQCWKYLAINWCLSFGINALALAVVLRAKRTSQQLPWKIFISQFFHKIQFCRQEKLAFCDNKGHTSLKICKDCLSCVVKIKLGMEL